MSSKKLTQTTLFKYKRERPEDLKKPRNKFLTRNLKIGHQDEAAYRMFRTKRFYIKKVFDPRGEDPFYTDHAVVSRIFKNRKVYKTIKTAHVPFSIQHHIHTNLKNAKNLKNYGFYTDSSANPIDNVAFYLKKLSSKVQSIHLEIWKGEVPFKNQDLYDIAHSIRRFQKLKYFNRATDMDTDEVRTHVQRELGIYNQSVSRLKDLKKITFTVGSSEQPSFRRIVRRGCVFPGITGLRFRLLPRMLPHRADLEQHYDEEDSFDETPTFDEDEMTDNQKEAYRKVQDQIRQEDEEKGDDLRSIVRYKEKIEKKEDGNSDAVTVASESLDTEENPVMNDENFIAKCIMREEMRSLYSFEVFPNLKELDIMQWSHLYPLDSFVIDGFKSLRNLENLKITMCGRSKGTSYLFKGFLELPQLKKFDFYINFVKNKDWIDLKQFLENQKELETLSLSVGELPSTKSRYLWQNSYLEEIIQGLENKPKLKSLELRSSFWPLESLSKGLSHLTRKNQFQTFTITGCDDTLTSNEKLENRIGGICQFIENQADSLRELGVFLSLALDDKLVNHLGKAIEKLTHLKNLELKFHRSLKSVKEVMIPSLEETLFYWDSPPPEKLFVIPKKWNPSLAKYINKLSKLENFSLDFGILNPKKEDAAEWFVDIMKVLPNLKRLRKIKIMAYEDGALKNEEQKIFNALRELKNIKKIDIELYDNNGDWTPTFYKTQDLTDEIYAKQALRNDLMF